MKIQYIWYFCGKENGMVIFPKAKINLGLRITWKRADGYHNIETIFYPVDLQDALEIVCARENAKQDVLEVTGIPVGGKPEDNLVIKSVKKFRDIHSFPFLRIHLHKAIPSGAGLGGGSSDAACILKVINRCFRFSLSPEELQVIALGLGSDCPFFIDCKPSFATGRGEILQPVASVLSGLHIVLVNPGISISTREAYENCIPRNPEKSLFQLIDLPIVMWKEMIVNDFEKFIFKKYPGIGSIKQSLYSAGALYSSMSGSGSAVYGIFQEKPEIKDTLKRNVIFEGVLE